eukprot:c6053_g1_i1.p1 GENE.c6053_g1_i1~~c6053_g1_i1.p1  ORF type:complete len:1129 (-),score=270.73 c6053_g1_i1:234-3533(-)
MEPLPKVESSSAPCPQPSSSTPCPQPSPQDSTALITWLSRETNRLYDVLTKTRVPSFETDNIDDLLPPPSQWGKRKSNVAIITACSGSKYEQKGSLNQRTIAEHTWRNKQLYATVRGYDAINVDLGYYTHSSTATISKRQRLYVWAKIPVLKGCLLHYEYCFWVDADLVITNPEISVESFFDDSEKANGHRASLVVGKTFELMALDDPRIPSPAGYRLNTGTLLMRRTDWSLDFLDRVWNMEGIDEKGRREYIETYNHEQSVMQYFMRYNPSDLAETYFPPHQAINIHNAFSGPNDRWHPGSFLIHYYGGFQGCPGRPNLPRGANACVDEFIEHCYRAAELVPVVVRYQVYPDWDSDKERKGKAVDSDVTEKECHSPVLDVMGLSKDVAASVWREVERWPSLPAELRVPLAKHPAASSWMQELYIRLHRVMFWKYLLPVDMDLGRSRGSAVALYALEKIFLPAFLETHSFTPGPCLEWENTHLSTSLLKEACIDTQVVSRSGDQCSGEAGSRDGGYCGDLGDGQTTIPIPDSKFTLVISTLQLQHSLSPWLAVRRMFDVTAPGGHVVLTLPTVMMFHTEPQDLWRFTVEGASELVQSAGFCVVRVQPLSNIAVTAAHLLGYAAEDFTHEEHAYVDPVSPVGVMVIAMKPKSECSAGEGSCCAGVVSEGVAVRKPIECWRGLFGGKDANSAKAWGCDEAIERQYSWSGKPWYQVDFERDTRVPGASEGLTEARPSPAPINLATAHVCASPLLRYLGMSPLAQLQAERDVMTWPPRPAVLAAPLASPPPQSHILHELYLRLHRLLYWKYLIPFDLNMGWSRGSPLDRIFIEQVFFDRVKQHPLPSGACLEWGNSYMSGTFAENCRLKFEMLEDVGPCGGSPGVFERNKAGPLLSPPAKSQSFEGGFCGDIHDTAGVMPDNYFDMVISTFVFEHLRDPVAAMRNIYRAMAPGGALVWAAPGTEIYHANEGDYWRFTVEGAKHMVEAVGFCVVRVQPCSTASVTAGFLMGFADADFSPEELHMSDPLGPHTVAVLAVKPTCNDVSECPCPPYSGVDLHLMDCFRGTEKGCDLTTRYDWSTVPASTSFPSAGHDPTLARRFARK